MKTDFHNKDFALIYFFIYLLFCHTQQITSRINRLINIEYKIFILLGRSDCGGEISKKPSSQMEAEMNSEMANLCHPKCARKVSGLSRNGRLALVVLRVDNMHYPLYNSMSFGSIYPLDNSIHALNNL